MKNVRLGLGLGWDETRMDGRVACSVAVHSFELNPFENGFFWVQKKFNTKNLAKTFINYQ
jgi:hypothetical protein